MSEEIEGEWGELAANEFSVDPWETTISYMGTFVRYRGRRQYVRVSYHDLSGLGEQAVRDLLRSLVDAAKRALVDREL